jgi:hypothetical protein
LTGGRLLRNKKVMPRTSKKKSNADEVAEMATRGEDISTYFNNKFTVVRPVCRMNEQGRRGRTGPKKV